MTVLNSCSGARTRWLELMEARGNDPDQGEAALAERHGGGPASRWESRWIDVGIWAFALVTTALTLWYSLGPRPPGHGSDKQLHSLAYFVNTLAILLAIVWRPGRSRGRFDARTVPVAVGMLVLGGVIEVVQGGFVRRDSQFTDWAGDSVGIILAVMVFAALRRGLPSSDSLPR
jgi:VanZ family protein